MQIVEYKQRLNFSHAQMARALGVHKQTWIKWCRNEQRTPAVAIRMLDTLLWLNNQKKIDHFLEVFTE